MIDATEKKLREFGEWGVGVSKGLADIQACVRWEALVMNGRQRDRRQFG